MGKPALWAAYLHITRPSEKHVGETERHQWVFIPPVPQELMPRGKEAILGFSFYHRHQDKLTQKSVWKHSEGRTREQFAQGIASYEMEHWVADELITCQVADFELAKLAKEGFKTPYGIISRLRRVSDVTHRYTI